MPSAMKAFRFTESELELLGILFAREQEQKGDGASAIGSLRAVIADGLKLRMMSHGKPIAAYLLDPLKPEGVIEDYLHFLQAVNRDVGLKDSDGHDYPYRLEQIPAGGKWEKFGAAGKYAILHDKERLTIDGTEYAAGE